MTAPVFVDGELGPEIRRKLNEMGTLFQEAIDGLFGPQGWSPVLAVVADGTREVLEVVDWVGGQDTKPTTLGYVGALGIVSDIALAVNIRGGKGDDGAPGPANSLEIGTVTEGASASATVTGTTPSQTLNLVLPRGSDGSDGLNGWSPVFAAVADGARIVLQVADWAGGTGTKPATGQYVGTTGLVALLADAVNIRGPAGSGGGGSGDVTGPGSATDGAVALFDGATGKVLKAGGVLGTGAFAAEDKWAVSIKNVMFATVGAAAPSTALGSYYPLSNVVVADGHLAAKGSTGDIYTMTGGSWVLTDATGDGVRLVVPSTGPQGPRIYFKSGGSAINGVFSQDAASIRYSEGTAGTDFVSYTVRSKLDEIGVLSTLVTAAKSKIVLAINEIVGRLNALGTAAELNVAASGNAAAGEVVKGDDSRLSDSRTPTAHSHGIGDVVGLNTALTALSDHLGATSGAHPASAIVNTPAGSISATTVQGALNELDLEKVSDAPSDGKQYARKNATWAEVAGGYATGDILMTARTLSTPDWLECDKVYLKSSYPDLSTLLGAIPGVVWSLATGNQPASPGPAAIGVSAVVTATGAIISVGSAGGIYRSTDNGNNFTKITGPNTTDGLYGICVAKNTTGQPDAIIAVGASGVVWRSISDGNGWSKITGPNTTDSLYGVAAFGNVGGGIVAVGPAGVVWKSTNIGASWTKITGPNTTDTLYHLIFTTSSNVVAVGPNGAIWRSNSGGDAASWTRVSVSATNSGQHVIRLNATTLLSAAPASRIARSTDDGVTWVDVGYTSGNTSNCVAIGRLSDTEVFVVQANGTIRHSIDSGATWTQVAQPYVTAGVSSAVAISGTKAAILGATFSLLMDGTYYDSSTQFITPKFGSAISGAKRYIKS